MSKIFFFPIFVLLLQGCTLTNDVKTNLICKGSITYEDRNKTIPISKSYTLIERTVKGILVDGLLSEKKEWVLIENDKVISEPRYRKDEHSSEQRVITVSEQNIHFVEFVDFPEYNSGNTHAPSTEGVTDIDFDRLNGSWMYKEHRWGSNSITKEKYNRIEQAFGSCSQVDKKF
jgi:hypothetical protein